VTYYPEKISARLVSPAGNGVVDEPSAEGIGASFVCGSFVRFSLNIDEKSGEVRELKFKTNGCGFAIAAADVLATTFSGKKLSDLHGLIAEDVRKNVATEFGAAPQHRAHCLDICIEAIRAAFADYRRHRLKEYSGENALICTCFGVSEDRVAACIRENNARTFEQISSFTKAGSGCGACRMLIQELLDSAGID
jgi:NifU-like protein